MELERHNYDVVVVGAGVRACGPRSKPTSPARAPPSSASPCWARRTRSWQRAASPPRWPTCTRRTTGGCTSATPCAAGRCSTTGHGAAACPGGTGPGAGARGLGRCSTGRRTGLISQRDFGGHRYARLAHVGDRTGLELIRTLQQRTVALGIDVYMECTVTRLLTDRPGRWGGPRTGRHRGVRLLARVRPVRRLAGARRSCWPPVGSASPTRSSNSWEYTGDGHSLALQAGASLVNMEFVQFHPTGMVWPPSVRGILVTESVRGDGGILKNSAAAACSTTSPTSSARRRRRPRPRPTAGTTTRRTPAATGAAPRDEVARAINEVKAGRGAAAASTSTSPPADAGVPASGCPRCTTSSRSWPRSTSPPRRWRWGPPATT